MPAVKTYKLHDKFRQYWRYDYEERDLQKVCSRLAMLMKVKNQKRGSIEWTKHNWGSVCNFLISWEGK